MGDHEICSKCGGVGEHWVIRGYREDDEASELVPCEFCHNGLEYRKPQIKKMAIGEFDAMMDRIVEKMEEFIRKEKERKNV